MAKLIFGCGYLGSRVARQWREAGETVYAVTRSADKAGRLAEEGLRPVLADVTSRNTLRGLPQADTVLYAVGFGSTSERSVREVYLDGVRNVLESLPNQVKRFIYISSTGVYGSFAGGWVNEDSPCQPARETGRACLEAERLLAASRFGSKSVVLRLAGLYGPGRVPRRDELTTGQVFATPGGHLNLIHVEDAAAVVLAADARAPLPRLYVVSDGHPVERAEYHREIARLLALPPPPDDPAAARAAADKRIDNSRMLAELRVALRYPSYRQGLAAILAEQADTRS